MDPKQVCAQAAEIIQRDGWYQGDFYDEPETTRRPDETTEEYIARQAYEDWLAETSAPVCAMGAIRRAVTGGSVMNLPVGSDRMLVLNAADLLAGSVGSLATRLDIPAWNDAPERSAEDVILALKRAATDE
ncbi:DUF6197 family protein [Streptomyces sp. NPDC002754]